MIGYCAIYAGLWRWLIVGLSLLSIRFNPRWYQMRFMVERWQWSKFFSEFLWCSPVNHYSAVAHYTCIAASWGIWCWASSMLAHPWSLAGASSLTWHTACYRVRKYRGTCHTYIITYHSAYVSILYSTNNDNNNVYYTVLFTMLYAVLHHTVVYIHQIVPY
jgi:hypothetical protein